MHLTQVLAVKYLRNALLTTQAMLRLFEGNFSGSTTSTAFQELPGDSSLGECDHDAIFAVFQRL